MMNVLKWLLFGMAIAIVAGWQGGRPVRAAADEQLGGGRPFTGAASIDVRQVGALGDGVHDDTKAIQDAINALWRAKGGVLSFPPGQYRISHPLRLSSTSNFEIRGTGAVLKPVDSMIAPARGWDGDTLIIVHCYGFAIEGLGFDGSAKARGHKETPASLRLVDCADFRISAVTFRDAICDHLYLSASNPAIDRTACQDGMIAGCTFDGAWRNAISIIHAHDITVRDNAIRNVSGTAPQCGIDIEANLNDCDRANQDISVTDNAFRGCAGSAIEVPGVKTPRFISICRNRISDGVHGVNIPDDTVSDLTVADNLIHDLSGVGIAIGGAHGVVRGNILTTGGNFGIYASGGPHVISGNVLTDFGRPKDGKCITTIHCTQGAVISANVIRKTTADRNWTAWEHGPHDLGSENYQFGCAGADGPIK